MLTPRSQDPAGMIPKNSTIMPGLVGTAPGKGITTIVPVCLCGGGEWCIIPVNPFFRISCSHGESSMFLPSLPSLPLPFILLPGALACLSPADILPSVLPFPSFLHISFTYPETCCRFSLADTNAHPSSLLFSPSFTSPPFFGPMLTTRLHPQELESNNVEGMLVLKAP
ncbi:hypothetical protein B0H10DRAFT_2210501 [Mycena sp. CBHHK59/15]|nr:hypothetical protein B0H10DRAFT_2210501 [Mycena sp. CBHHK59/15]